MNKRKLLSGLMVMILIFAASFTNAQPFAKDIAAFKRADSIGKPFPGVHPVLFIGSSSFTKWTNVQDYFPGVPIINRGFGGSSLPDVIRYAKDIIYPYHAKQVVIYCGENDLASADSVSAKEVFERFKKLYRVIKRRSAYTHVAFVSIKPSPSRKSIQPKVMAANALIRSFLSRKKDAVFIDIYSLMLNKDGSMMQELFLEDDLHMNAKGYAIWQKAIWPYLLK